MAEFPVKDEDIRALRLDVLRALSAAAYPKEAIPHVAQQRGLKVDDVRALVADYGWPDRKEMQRFAFEMEGKTPPKPTPAQPVRNGGGPRPAPLPQLAGDPIGALLAAGEKSAKKRGRHLAAKIREQLAELRDLVEVEAKERAAAEKAAAEKARLKAELKELEEQIAATRKALGRKSRPEQRRSDNADIRAWATAQGMEVNPFGRIAAEVREAYDAAHPSEAAS